MVQPCPECRQTRRHTLTCTAPNRALRRDDGETHTVDTVDTYSPTDTGFDYCSTNDTSGPGGDSATCGGE